MRMSRRNNSPLVHCVLSHKKLSLAWSAGVTLTPINLGYFGILRATNAPFRVGQKKRGNVSYLWYGTLPLQRFGLWFIAAMGLDFAFVLFS